MVDAPVSGFSKVTPLLKSLGKHIFHVGPLGAGHAVKALNNYLGAAGTLAGFEALLVARAPPSARSPGRSSPAPSLRGSGWR